MPLSAKSAAAIARLRAFRPPPSTYPSLPLSRRAAVLILLFADRRGELRVVLTIRSAKLRNYAGHAALPGGKAEDEDGGAWETARREAEEEIGLPRDAQGLASAAAELRGQGQRGQQQEIRGAWEVERLAELPVNLAITELGVRPCVGFLAPRDGEADPLRDLLPALDAREVAAVFTAPFEGFLKKRDVDARDRAVPGEWYQGTWMNWHEERWRMHQFYVPQGVVYKSSEEEDKAQQAGRARDLANNALDEPRFRVFGMTARILVDAARVAYGEEPEFEHNSHFGDEDMIRRLRKMGRLSTTKRENDGLTKEVMQQAKKTKL